MKSILGAILFVAVMAIGGPASAQSSGADGVENLLQRIDDIEKKRREAKPGAIAPAGLAEAPKKADASGGGLELVLWALGVAALIFGAAMVVRVYRGPQLDAELAKALEVEDSMWVGRGQRLLLIRVRDQELLVGATGSQLTSLAVLDRGKSSESSLTEEPMVDDEPKVSRRRDAEKFASRVQEELTNAAAGGPPRNKQQILRRLNSL